MRKLTKLATSNKVNIKNTIPLTEDEIKNRHSEYISMPNDKFRKKYRHHINTAITMEFMGKPFELQLNKCYNPFCKWYGLPQYKYDSIKSKPSRYKLGSTYNDEVKLYCNEVNDVTIPGEAFAHTNEVLSNWSVAEEIKRLVTINSVMPMLEFYNFHKEHCKNTTANPFQNSDLFYKRGKSTSNSSKYQCKDCKKITNVLPLNSNSFYYHQGRNEILSQFTKDLLSRTPVRRTCEKLNIASGTYYSKLEWLYEKCLEFLEKHETETLNKMNFNEVWLNTDKLVYYLNNIRVKGKGGKKVVGEKDQKLQTGIIASGDLKTGYVFRSDIAYDFNVNFDEIELDTQQYHCDHSYSFLRKNERLKYAYSPQTPTSLDNQTEAEYLEELDKFNKRKDYVPGCHTKIQYTATAHYWLINQLVHTPHWYFVSDDDATLQSCIFRIFSDYIKSKDAHYFTCQYDKSRTLQEAGEIFFRNRQALKQWGKDHGFKNCSIEDIAVRRMELDLIPHDFYEYKMINGKNCPIRSINPVVSPLADKDEGERFIKCITDVRGIPTDELARLLVNVNSRTINNFFQELRRRVSILERPLVSGRGDGKSYIYSNYNPKYAQYAVTIFRTFYNFCWLKKLNGKLLTPAQRLGITDKVYNVKDIIYFK